MTARMEDNMLIPKVGMMLWGAEWQAPMAAALKQPTSTVADWARGRTPVPAGIWKELREIVRLHGLKIADLDPEIVRAYDTAVALASRTRT
jgi:hypothetical protein